MMPSPSFLNFENLCKRTDTLLSAADNLAAASEHRRRLYATSILTSCAAWESYIEGLVRVFYSEMSFPRTGNATPLHLISMNAAEGEVKKFNTPNSNNARNLLLKWCDFDPWPYWVWPRHNLNQIQARQRLDDLVAVRHSIAHGFNHQSIQWSNSKKGRVTKRVAINTVQFFIHLAQNTDSGMSSHLSQLTGNQIVW